jgi:hypothetical protein
VGSSGTLGAFLDSEQFLVRTDAGGPPHSAVGLFRVAPPPGQLSELIAELRKLEAAGPLPPSQDRPGTPMLSFGLKEGETTKIAWSSPANAVPDLLSPAVTRIRGLIEQTLSHPVDAVGARAEWQADSVAAGQDLQLRLVITNPGEKPQTVANPATGGGGAPAVRITLIRDRKPQQSGDVTFHDLAPAEIRQLEDNGVDLVGSPAETLALAPEQEVAFSLRKTVRLAPATYRANLSLVVTPAGEGTDSAARGTITLELPAVTITR